MLKQKNDGSWLIENLKDLDAAAIAIEEREGMIKEIENRMEEEYDYLSLQEEVAGLKETLRSFMDKNDHAAVVRPTYQISLVRRSRTSWNETKLKALVPKPIWMKITKLVVDRDKIDDLAREGVIDMDKIAPALESKPEKPYLRWYYKNEKACETEAAELAKVLDG
jgi:hypothetical protein